MDRQFYQLTLAIASSFVAVLMFFALSNYKRSQVAEAPTLTPTIEIIQGSPN